MPEITHAAVLERLEAEVARAGSQRALARGWGVSHVFVNDVLHGRRLPGPDMARRLGVRVEREIVHRFYSEAPDA